MGSLGTACVLAASCARAPSFPALGADSDVVLYADSGVQGFESVTARLAAPGTWFGDPEPAFRCRIAGPAPRRPLDTNVVLASLLDGDGSTARLVRRVLPPRARGALRDNKPAWFAFEDVFARGQRVYVFCATRQSDLESLVVRCTPTLQVRLEADLEMRVRDALLESAPEAADTRHLAAEKGFSLRAPGSYRFRDGVGSWPRAVELVASGPTRSLSVFWLDGVDSSAAKSPDFVAGFARDFLWQAHGDVLVDESSTVTAPAFAGFDALRLRGVWQNPRDVGGGALETHFVYDPGRRRLYGVQTLLFAPGRSKLPWLRELRALAATFRVERA